MHSPISTHMNSTTSHTLSLPLSPSLAHLRIFPFPHWKSAGGMDGGGGGCRNLERERERERENCQSRKKECKRASRTTGQFGSSSVGYKEGNIRQFSLSQWRNIGFELDVQTEANDPELREGIAGEMRLAARFAGRKGGRRKTSSCHFHLNFKFFAAPPRRAGRLCTVQ